MTILVGGQGEGTDGCGNDVIRAGGFNGGGAGGGPKCEGSGGGGASDVRLGGGLVGGDGNPSRCGLTDYLEKPFDVDTLLARVAALLGD